MNRFSKESLEDKLVLQPNTGLEGDDAYVYALHQRIEKLLDEVEFYKATCEAHITVINDLSDQSLHVYNKWLWTEHEKRIRQYNERLVQTIDVNIDLQKKIQGYRSLAERAIKALADYEGAPDGSIYRYGGGFYSDSHRNGMAGEHVSFKIITNKAREFVQEKNRLADSTVGARERNDQVSQQANEVVQSED